MLLSRFFPGIPVPSAISIDFSVSYPETGQRSVQLSYEGFPPVVIDGSPRRSSSSKSLQYSRTSLGVLILVMPLSRWFHLFVGVPILPIIFFFAKIIGTFPSNLIITTSIFLNFFKSLVNHICPPSFKFSRQSTEEVTPTDNFFSLF